jgi:hypothetical protein
MFSLPRTPIQWPERREKNSAAPPPLPGRGAFTQPVDDGRILVDTSTGEILETPPSRARAARLAPRIDAHRQRLAAELDAARERARRWAPRARAALPARTPPGLERPAVGPLGGTR